MTRRALADIKEMVLCLGAILLTPCFAVLEERPVGLRNASVGHKSHVADLEVSVGYNCLVADFVVDVAFLC